jgi:hypothetical protein
MVATDIVHLREKAGRFFVYVLWAHLPIIGMVGLLNGRTPYPAIALAGLIAAAATLAFRASRTGAATRYVIAVGQVAMVSLLVFIGGGKWEIDFHMYYFAALAMLAAFCDWRTISWAPRQPLCTTSCSTSFTRGPCSLMVPISFACSSTPPSW